MNVRIKHYSREREANIFVATRSGWFSYHSLLSRGWTLSRREGDRVQLRYAGCRYLPVFKTVDEAGEVYRRPTAKPCVQCFATSGEYFDSTRRSGDCLLATVALGT